MQLQFPPLGNVLFTLGILAVLLAWIYLSGKIND